LVSDFSFSTSSAGSQTDVLGGRTTESPIYYYQYVTLAGTDTGYHNVSQEKLVQVPLEVRES